MDADLKMAIAFARNEGYDSAEPLREGWNGYKAYEAIMYPADGRMPKVGLPRLIIKDGESFRMSTLDESLVFMDRL